MANEPHVRFWNPTEILNKILQVVSKVAQSLSQSYTKN